MNDRHAACYADRAVRRTVRVEHNAPVAERTYRLRFACPEMARPILPGQFLMLRLPGCDDPLLGRPMALYDTLVYDTLADIGGQPSGIEVMYWAGGKFTQRLSRLQPGQDLIVWGPLGNGFTLPPTEHLVMVAGGIGQTPFLALAQECLGQRTYGEPPRAPATAARVTLCYGVRTAAYLAGLEDFQRAGVAVRVATDDGTHGHHGLVTELLEQVLAEMANGANGDRSNGDRGCRIVCCGPHRMMNQTARIAQQQGLECQVSLETPMACGVGICFTCVTRIRDGDGGWDYRRTCVEGPVFDARRIVW